MILQPVKISTSEIYTNDICVAGVLNKIVEKFHGYQNRSMDLYFVMWPSNLRVMIYMIHGREAITYYTFLFYFFKLNFLLLFFSWMFLWNEINLGEKEKRLLIIWSLDPYWFLNFNFQKNKVNLSSIANQIAWIIFQISMNK